MRKLDRGQLEDLATTMSAGSSPDDTPNAANYDGLWIRVLGYLRYSRDRNLLRRQPKAETVGL
jgi:hypothetical protein